VFLQGKRIYVAGHRGLAGGAVVRELQRQGHTDLALRTHAELDLEDAAATLRFFEQVQPQVVFLCAAKVGGILANNSYPADFLFRNLAIQQNVISAAHAVNVERLVFLGSSCIYPRECPQPIREEYLLTGPLEATNRPYALAKIAGIEMCWSLNRQHGRQFLAAMPTNLYGPGDTYDLANSHVLPALMMKMHAAKRRREATVTVWGSGRPRRELLFVDDLGRAVVFLANLDPALYASLTSGDRCPLINVGTGEDVSVAELAEAIAEAVGYTGSFSFDASKPDGTMRKVLDISRLTELGWAPMTSLKEGLAKTYADFLGRHQQA
jgi:GDP-L-fucose synthase